MNLPTFYVRENTTNVETILVYFVSVLICFITISYTCWSLFQNCSRFPLAGLLFSLKIGRRHLASSCITCLSRARSVIWLFCQLSCKVSFALLPWPIYIMSRCLRVLVSCQHLKSHRSRRKRKAVCRHQSKIKRISLGKKWQKKKIGKTRPKIAIFLL